MELFNISCVGDSLTYGYGVDNREDNCYPHVLNNLLGDDFVVGNFGVNGATILKTGDLPYWDHENFKMSGMIDPHDVIIMLGSNDSKAHNFTNMDEFINTYEEMINHYRSLPSKPRIYIVTPPTVFPAQDGASSSIQGDIVASIAEAIRGLGKKLRVSVIDIHKKTADYPEGFLSDGVHTNIKGAKFMAELVFRELSKK